MKKFVLYGLTCLMLIVGVCTFSACKDGDYDLSKLSIDYGNLVSSHEYIVRNDQGLTVNFNSDVLSEKIKDNDLSFKYIQSYYNVLFENNSSFFDKYIYVINDSEYNNKVPANKRNTLKSSLEEFDNSLTRFDNNAKNIIDWLRLPVSGNEATGKTFLVNLFSSYEDVFKAQAKLSEDVADIYFNHVRTEVFNRESIAGDSLDSLVRTKVAVEAEYQKFNLSDVYINMNIYGTSMAEDLVKKSPNGLDSMFINWYLPSINAISKDLSSTNVTNEADFRTKLITVYELRTQLNNLNYPYVLAKNCIEYCAKKNDYNSTATEKKYCKTMSNYEALTTQYNDALNACISMIN